MTTTNRVSRYRLKQWVKRCARCQESGYDPKQLESVAAAAGEDTDIAQSVRHVRDQFKPLPLDTDGLCEKCRDVLAARREVQAGRNKKG